jgi:general secretion pathway protein L
MSESTIRLHWPRDGVAVRVPPRRLAGEDASCELIPFTGRRAQAPRRHPWQRLADGVPRGTAVVLLVAAEDVSFTTADVPALSGMRLREALPNLVEDQTVGEVGTLHVALGPQTEKGQSRALAVVDRHWLAAIQVHAVRSGLRVAAIVPESLIIPFAAGTWSLGCVGSGAGLRCWLRTEGQQAMPLPADPASAVAVAAALTRQAGRPSQLMAYGAADVDSALGESLAAALAVPRVVGPSDPFSAWLAGDGPDGGYGVPMSLLAFDRAAGRTWIRWRIAAALAALIVAVQIVGMQWQWAGLRREAGELRRQSVGVLTTTCPETHVVLDAPLQMARGLAGLRASSGRSDPADFSTMMAASARIFAALPSNALRGADYDARTLRLRFAPGNAMAADERDRFVAAAAQEGYTLRFEGAANAAGEAQASLRQAGAAS